MAAPSPGGTFPNYNVDLSHVEDPNERRRQALARIDNAPFGWRHARTVVVAGVGFSPTPTTSSPSVSAQAC